MSCCVFFANRIVGAVSSGDKVQIPWQTPHSTLYTPHSTLHTLQFTLYTLHSTLYTLHCTLLTPNFTLHTLHSSTTTTTTTTTTTATTTSTTLQPIRLCIYLRTDERHGQQTNPLARRHRHRWPVTASGKSAAADVAFHALPSRRRSAQHSPASPQCMPLSHATHPFCAPFPPHLALSSYPSFLLNSAVGIY